ncbi:substrate-binding domain-containing protein, partial [Paractinoplanes toevensis]|uniref:substrate-binding domain-containing protein n=1 Tax=Paractinoplanes toevensis TaxID=571911 RepID=UPI001BB44897
SPDDNNATFFYNGAMSVLQPYLDRGTLKVPSKQTDFRRIAILRWQARTAQDRMENILTSTYRSGLRVDGVLSPYDGLSIGIVSALRTNGYGTAGRPYPVITGQDAEVASVKSIIAGEQYSTIFKDYRDLAKTSAQMADAILKGQKPVTNNDKDYDNGVKVVPSMLLDTAIVNKTNYEKALIDSGFYKRDQLS